MKTPTKFTFEFKNGKLPISSDGKICWKSNKEEALKEAKSWDAGVFYELDDDGNILDQYEIV